MPQPLSLAVAQPTLVQQAVGQAAASLVVSATLPVAPLRGSLIVVHVASDNNSAAPVITGGGVFSSAIIVQDTAHNPEYFIWGIASTNATPTITVTFTGTAGQLCMNVSEWSGADVPGCWSVAGSGIAAGASVAPLTPTLAATGRGPLLIFAGGSFQGSSSAGPTNGFVALTNQSTGTNHLRTAYLVQQTDGDVSTGWTIPNTGWSAGIIAFSMQPTIYDQMILSEPSLWGYWPRLTGTSAMDASGYDHHGTYINTPTRGVASGLIGEGNTAMSTVKASSQYVNFAGFLPNGSELTLEIWAKLPTNETDITPLSATASGQGFNLYVVGLNQFRLDANGSNATTTYNVPGGFGSTWHHCVGTYDGKILSCYFDGVLVGQSGAMTGPLLGVGALKMGQYGAPGGSYGTCSYDKPAIYNRALSATDVARHYSVGTTGKYGPIPMISR